MASQDFFLAERTVQDERPAEASHPPQTQGRSFSQFLSPVDRGLGIGARHLRAAGDRVDRGSGEVPALAGRRGRPTLFHHALERDELADRFHHEAQHLIVGVEVVERLHVIARAVGVIGLLHRELGVRYVR